jgi:hypothetical protein
VQVIEVSELNAYDVLCSDVVVFTTATLPVAEPIGKTARRTAALDGDAAAVEEAAPAPAATKAPAKKAAKAPAPVEEAEPAADEPVADEAVADADEAVADADEAPHGPGSHAPLEDDEQPEGFAIKGNADSMLYHLPGSRFYNQTKAEVWFATETDAEAAGFSLPASQQAEHDEAGQDDAGQDEEES